MANSYTMPNAKLTKSVKKYIKAWEALIKPIEKEFEMQTIGFDPSISMKHKNGGRAVEIPVWFAEKLVALINDKNIPPRQ